MEESTLRIRFKLCCIVKSALFFQTNVFVRVFIFVIIVLFMMRYYDGNIYPYKTSNLQTQKESILFGKLLKIVFQIVDIPWTSEFAVECHGQTVLFLKKEKNPHAK